jgi:succinate dehydrogenase/fumarate reductase-like Fe-S protein
MIYNLPFGIAGTIDVVGIRNCKDLIIDVEDFKSNLEKGITFDTISRKGEKYVHYNRYMKTPLDHLEACNYNRYCLQLSLYAFMLTEYLGGKIGRLAIRWIEMSQDGRVDFTSYIPVPYMKTEVSKLLIEHCQAMKSIAWK